jgi:hypothetical protein
VNWVFAGVLWQESVSGKKMAFIVADATSQVVAFHGPPFGPTLASLQSVPDPLCKAYGLAARGEW